MTYSPSTAAHSIPASAARKLAVLAGAFYLITHVTSVGALLLYAPILDNVDYITSAGSTSRVMVGALFEIILALAVVGTAIALFPVVRQRHESGALGYVALRTLEAGIITIGVIPLLAIITLRQDVAGTADADAASLVTIGQSLVAVHDWTFLVMGLVVGVHTVLMASVLYRTRLVPRFIPILGLIGGPVVFASNAAVMFGVYNQISALAMLAAIPVFAWELSLAFRLILKGFSISATAAETARPATKEALVTA